MKTMLTLFLVPLIMIVLSIGVPQTYVVQLNIIEIILFVVHCLLCRSYVKKRT